MFYNISLVSSLFYKFNTKIFDNKYADAFLIPSSGETNSVKQVFLKLDF